MGVPPIGLILAASMGGIVGGVSLDGELLEFEPVPVLVLEPEPVNVSLTDATVSLTKPRD